MKLQYNTVLAVSSFAVLRCFVKVSEKIVEVSSSYIFQEVLLASALLLMLFGSLLVLRTLSSRWLSIQKMLELLSWGIIIALTGALGNIGQLIMMTICQDGTMGAVIGGAAGGLIAACGGGVIYLLDKLSRSHMAFLGAFLLFIGFFLELIQIILLLSALH